MNILVFLPLSRGRTHHPRFPELLAHGFSPALLVPSRVGSSKLRGGWPLASLICGLLTALCEPHAPSRLFRLTGDRATNMLAVTDRSLLFSRGLRVDSRTSLRKKFQRCLLLFSSLTRLIPKHCCSLKTALNITLSHSKTLVKFPRLAHTIWANLEITT